VNVFALLCRRIWQKKIDRFGAKQFTSLGPAWLIWVVDMIADLEAHDETQLVRSGNDE
jgi:hypothetical protein